MILSDNLILYVLYNQNASSILNLNRIDKFVYYIPAYVVELKMWCYVPNSAMITDLILVWNIYPAFFFFTVTRYVCLVMPG